MRDISDKALADTLTALSKYAAFHQTVHPKNTPRLLLMKTHAEDGSTKLQAVSEKEMGIFDKIASLFGISRFNLRTIVNFLQSDAMLQKLDKTRLEGKNRQIFEAAAHTLDLKIKQHQGLSISPKNQTLSKTLMEHLQVPKDRTAYELKVSKHELKKHSHALEAKIPTAFKEAAHLAKKGHFDKCFDATKGIKDDLKPLIDYSVKLAEERLTKEMLKGRLIIDSKGTIATGQKNHWFKDFEELVKALPENERQATLNSVINKTHLTQELRRAELKLLPQQHYLQLKVLEELCHTRSIPFPTRQETMAAYSKCLIAHLEKSSLSQNPEEFCRELEKMRHTALYSACKIPEEKVTMWDEAIGAVLVERYNLRKVYEKETSAVLSGIQSQNFLELTKARLKRNVIYFIYKNTTEPFEAFVKGNVKKLENGTMTLEQWKKALASFHDSAVIDKQSKDFDKKIQAKIEFFKKWRSSHKAEMSQGFHDEGEVLGQGICWGISLRWAVEELKRTAITKDTSILEKLDVGKTFPYDRLRQALYSLTFTGWGEAKEVSKLKQRLGITKTSRVNIGMIGLNSKERIYFKLKSHFEKKSFQTKGQGVAQLSFSWEDHGHAICVVCYIDARHPEKSIFRFSDPNYGTYEFPVENDSKLAMEKSKDAMCRCLSELMTTFYSEKFDYIAASTFELKL